MLSLVGLRFAAPAFVVVVAAAAVVPFESNTKPGRVPCEPERQDKLSS